MEEEIGFFTNQKNSSLLQAFLAQLLVTESRNDFEKSRNFYIRIVIQSMIGDPDFWDESCKFNIALIGDGLISSISRKDGKYYKEELDDIFSACIRFLIEYYIFMQAELNPDFERGINFAFDNIDSFNQKVKSQIEYSGRFMPIKILKSVVHKNSVLKFVELHDDLESKRKDWDKDLSERESRVNNLNDTLERHETAFNFVGLSNGFEKLSKEKRDEISSLKFWLMALGFLIVTPLITELTVLYFNLDNFDSIKNVLALSIVPVGSLVVILIYYFRVILFNYKSVKSQLLQIELRKTLCSFIQSYSKYSSELKENDPNSLEKFESIIFSGIVSDEAKLPATFDGIEQLGKLIKSVK